MIRGDRGSATVWVAIACLLVWAASVLVLSVGGAVSARHRAESVADLSALAGARASVSGASDPCVAAAAVAATSRGRLVACVQRPDGSVRVVAEVRLARILAWAHLPPARAAARAGAAVQEGELGVR